MTDRIAAPQLPAHTKLARSREDYGRAYSARATRARECAYSQYATLRT